ncbi:hypothetical protein Goarm_009041 [Gossypium armourianum]|uniref:Uncharacterized protein n=1 Tax=Gossypium armourianum TaxID=34283 RepID=A0A7J9JRT9_9ROSI|nr:hypothetical protein [Gossypium armourianum]
MDLCICFSPPFIMSRNLPVEETRELCCSAASALVTKLSYAIFIFLFAVGATLGALTGAFVGTQTKMGCLHGAMVGAIKGSFFSINLFKISLRIFRSDDISTTYLLQPVSRKRILLHIQRSHQG